MLQQQQQLNMPRLRLRLLPLPLLLPLLLLLLIGGTKAQGNFEDADKASDYTDQQFDLRHTIPGEPGVDYPILSEVPKTSFVCKGRHEGYYADVESRCQAFRICAHTARSAQGFGFLCPNGTIFSQQNFVCDWYRNVDCDQSERYYDMNRDNSVGSTQQMMERVRQMMEYPTQTVTKALQEQDQHITHHTLSKDLSSASGVLTQSTDVSAEDHILRGEDIKSEALPAPAATEEATPADGDDIYVNSLGELSSDPGIQFDHTNAHIIAEYPREYHYMKQKNFAERVNTGLELPSDTSAASNEQMAPDYIKQIRNTNDEATQLDLVSNINNLLEDVVTDLDPSISGYQLMTPHKVKQPFRFLSRGFSMQAKTDDDKDGSSSYLYNKPKQTPGTVRFTPNEIPIDAHKEHKHNFNNNDKTTSTTTTTEIPTTDEIEGLLIAPDLPPEFEEDTTSSTIDTTTEEAPVAPSYISELPLIESIGQAAALTASITLGENLQQLQNEPQSAAEADKTDVDVQAEKLLLAGVKQTSHDEESALRINQQTQQKPESTTSSTTATPITTPAMLTSTETVTEISSTQERIRSYRRFAQKRVVGPGGALRRQNFKSSHAHRTTNANGYSRNSQQPQRSTKPTTSNSYHYPKPAVTAAPALASLSIPQRPQQQQQQPQRPQQQQLPSIELSNIPGIVIARAEGQRIAPNSASSIISSLINKPQTKSTQANSYVALDDFLNNKFGQATTEKENVASPVTLQQQRQEQSVQQHPHQIVQQHQEQQAQPVPQKQQHQILQQQQHSQHQQHHQQQQQHQQHHQQQQQQHHQPNKQQQQQLSYITQPQQELQRPSIQSIQQPYLTANIFVPYQQQQQHLPLFPPLAGASLAATTHVTAGRGQQVDHLNVPLPALPNGLIPAPTLQVAQKRSDVNSNQLKLTSSKKDQGQEVAFYAGRTSYEVPQSSVGRLPNDITHLRRIRQQRY
ncbi:GH20446 [Drosophila grimshawi]|uniref:GH20446 n=1 Tax=Drosophila grimshawi TaxID=7222 RepID=B4J9G9_DROGR|nr:GH20446 [Drosophila grimshawi]